VNGINAAIDMTQQRRARWFDARMVDLVAAWQRDRDWWAVLADSANLDGAVLALEPGASVDTQIRPPVDTSKPATTNSELRR